MTPAAALFALIAVSHVALPSAAAAQQPPSTDSAAAHDRWFGPDKLKHFFVAAFTQSVAYSFLQAVRVEHGAALTGAWAATAAASVAKEVHDRRTTGVFSVRDLIWDAAGAGAASVMLTNVRRREPSADPPASGNAAMVAVRAPDRP